LWQTADDSPSIDHLRDSFSPASENILEHQERRR
jgi:hypothetical protein